MQSEFRIDVRSQDHATIVAVRGELDLASSPTLEEELERVAELESSLVVIDLRELEFMDSTGLSALLKANQRAEQAGQRFGVINGPQQVQRLLSLTGVAERLTVVEALEDLLGSPSQELHGGG